MVCVDNFVDKTPLFLLGLADLFKSYSQFQV